MAGAKRGCLFVVTLVVVLGAVVAGAGAWFFYQQTRFADAPITPSAERGHRQRRWHEQRAAQAARCRRGRGPGHPVAVAGAPARCAGKLKVGEYALSGELTPRELLLRMRAGKVLQHRVTIVEGWNIRQLRAALKRAEPLLHTTDTLDDAALMQRLGFGGQHPEGRFLPETYVYQRGDSDLDVLKRAHAAMEKALDEAWESRAPDLPINTPYELLTLASIIEKETALASERPQIAGVFMRRLKIGMRLQTDPTVIYGIGAAYDGNIRRRDLTTDTPYNTYTRAGLTPTPIAMPSRDALMARATRGGRRAVLRRRGRWQRRARVLAQPGPAQRGVARYLQQLRQQRTQETPAQ